MSNTLREALAWAGSRLGGDCASLDAQLLLADAIGRSRTHLFTWPEQALSPAELQRFKAAVERRARGEPVAYILGRQGFWDFDLVVTPEVLVPRPETETLVEAALALPLPGDARVLDLGTGSGAIALALGRERPGWTVGGVDRSPGAVALARENARRLGLERVTFGESDWFAQLGEDRYHLLVSNPPYVAPGDPHLEAGGLPWEPRAALVAEDEGLADLRELIATAPPHLLPGGWLLLEHGWDQEAAVQGLMKAGGFGEVRTWPDLEGRPRVTGGSV